MSHLTTHILGSIVAARQRPPVYRYAHCPELLIKMINWALNKSTARNLEEFWAVRPGGGQSETVNGTRFQSYRLFLSIHDGFQLFKMAKFDLQFLHLGFHQESHQRLDLPFLDGGQMLREKRNQFTWRPNQQCGFFSYFYCQLSDRHLFQPSAILMEFAWNRDGKG